MSEGTSSLNRRALLRGAAVGAIATPALVGKGLAQGQATWRVQAHWPKSSSSFDDSLQVIADLVEERTEGALKLELFGAGEFAKGPDIYNIVRRGVVPMGTIAPVLHRGQRAVRIVSLRHPRHPPPELGDAACGQEHGPRGSR